MKANNFLLGVTCGVGSIVLAGGLTGCSDKDDQPSISEPNKIELTAEQKQILSGIEIFSYELFNTVNRQLPEGQNVVVSPWGTVGLMSMMNCDNRGEAAKNINDILHQESYDDIQSEINETNKYLNSSLSTLSRKVDMSFNRSYWLKDGYMTPAAFSETMKEYYDVKLNRFSPEDNLKTLFDAWVAFVTNGVIESTQFEIADGTVWLMADVMNFKGKWKSRFEAVNTRPGVFHNADGSESVVPMMSQETSARIIYREGISAVFLDFADGEFTMQFVMTDGDLNDFAENINSETLQYSDRNPVIVTLPKFDITATYDLKKALTEMGLKADVDDQSGSDGLAMYQDCKTIVDEDGAQAVSVSVASGDGCPLTFTYTFDRPFIYIIKENSTGIIIQMGKVCRL